MKRRFALVAVILLATAALTACGSSKSAPAGAAVLDISITATSVTPMGATAAVAVNKPFTLKISATVAGELHVHSTPEQHVEFPVGTSEVTLTFKVPGTVVVEDHALDRQIVQIQVR